MNKSETLSISCEKCFLSQQNYDLPFSLFSDLFNSESLQGRCHVKYYREYPYLN